MSPSRAAVLFAGIGFLPGQPAGIPLLQTEPRLPSLYGDYIPSVQQLQPNMWFPPTTTLGGLPGGELAGLPQENGSDGFVTGAVNGALLDSEDQTGAGTGPAGSAPGAAAAPDAAAFALGIAAAPNAAVRYVCAQLPGQVQSGAQYWNVVASGRLPAVLAANVPGDPVEGPTGDPSNVFSPGPAGAWCRPSPLPFVYSSPLASRTFWLPVAVLLVGASLFLLSRGLRLAPRP